MTGSCSRIVPAAGGKHIEHVDAAAAMRLSRGDTAMFATRPVTHCPRHHHLPLVTVRQVLLQRLEGCSGTFRLLVRMTRCAPW